MKGRDGNLGSLGVGREEVEAASSVSPEEEKSIFSADEDGALGRDSPDDDESIVPAPPFTRSGNENDQFRICDGVGSKQGAVKTLEAGMVTEREIEIGSKKCSIGRVLDRSEPV